MGILDNLKSKIKEAVQVSKDVMSDDCCDEEKNLGKKNG